MTTKGFADQSAEMNESYSRVPTRNRRLFAFNGVRCARVASSDCDRGEVCPTYGLQRYSETDRCRCYRERTRSKERVRVCWNEVVGKEERGREERGVEGRRRMRRGGGVVVCNGKL